MTKATLRLFQCLAVLLACSPAFANSDLPPAKYDVGTAQMTDRAIRAAAEARVGHKLHWHRVEAGKAVALCDKLDGPQSGSTDDGIMGCQIGDHIVYSFDTKARAKLKHRQYYPDLWNRFMRHEIGHRLGYVHN